MTVNTLDHKQRPARVLLVEDNRGDVVLTQRAFNQAKVETQLFVAMSAEEALSMLHKEGEWKDLQTPDLILLDLNLPRMNGRELLYILKNDAVLKQIPVIVLSSSRACLDVVQSYAAHANGYVAKSLNLEDFQIIVKTLETFWFATVLLPDAEDRKKDCA